MSKKEEEVKIQSESNPKSNNQDFFKPLELTMIHYDNLIKMSIDEMSLLNIGTSKEDNIRILGEYHAIIQAILKKNLIFYYNEVDNLLFLGEKFKIHDFTQSYLYYLEYSDKLSNENIVVRIEKRNDWQLEISNENLEQQFKNRIKELSDDYLPKSIGVLKQNPQETSLARKKQYIQDYCNKYNHAYESFLVIALFLLILCHYILNEPTDKLINLLKKKRKLSVYELYESNNHSKYSPLLKECFSRIFKAESELASFFENVFGTNGLREMRNLIEHHLEEEDKCKITDTGIKLTYPKGLVENLTVKDIQNRYAKIFSITVQMYLHSIREKFDAFYILGKDIEMRENDKKKDS